MQYSLINFDNIDFICIHLNLHNITFRNIDSLDTKFSDSPIVTIKLGLSLKADDINEGDDVYFECDVQANPKAYKLAWYKDGKELHQNMTARIFLPSGQSLVLRSVTRNSAGEYSCMAVNVEGKSTSRPVTLEIMCE